jgi:hypothetical protein
MAAKYTSRLAEPLADPSGDGAEPSGPALTEKLWNRLRHKGELVCDEVTGRLPAVLRPLAWQEFRQMPLACHACWLLSQLGPEQSRQPELYRRQKRRPAGAGLFDDILQPDRGDKAKRIYVELCERHNERLASCPWLRPVLAGRARWMATHPARGSTWGRQMRRRKGGKHTQQRYREEGRHPLPTVRKSWGLPERQPPSGRVPNAAGQAMTKRPIA